MEQKQNNLLVVVKSLNYATADALLAPIGVSFDHDDVKEPLYYERSYFGAKEDFRASIAFHWHAQAPTSKKVVLANSYSFMITRHRDSSYLDNVSALVRMGINEADYKQRSRIPFRQMITPEYLNGYLLAYYSLVVDVISFIKANPKFVHFDDVREWAGWEKWQ